MFLLLTFVRLLTFRLGVNIPSSHPDLFSAWGAEFPFFFVFPLILCLFVLPSIFVVSLLRCLLVSSLLPAAKSLQNCTWVISGVLCSVHVPNRPILPLPASNINGADVFAFLPRYSLHSILGLLVLCYTALYPTGLIVAANLPFVNAFLVIILF